ncbi:MAG TPA: AMP-binding protein [Sulfuricaulis sp.]|nr:AMP-binding protein [Sulfuricaulis sp.]
MNDVTFPYAIDGCDSIPKLFWHRVAQHPEKVAMREKDFGIWNEYSWAHWGEQARLVGMGLMALGLERGDRCSIAAEICREWLFADLGIICAGGITNGVYPTDSPAQVEYLINDSGSRFYFAEDEEQLDKVLAVRERTPSLEKIIIFDMDGLRALDDPQCISFDELLDIGRRHLQAHPHRWQREIDAARPADVMMLTYTSGTTGPPKGAMISNGNVLFEIGALQGSLDVHPTDELLGFLPLAHIAGRLFYVFSLIESSATVNLVESLDTVAENQQQVGPTTHFAVPRVWEKQYSTVTIMLKEGTPLGRRVYEFCLALGKRVADHRQRGERLPLHLWLPWQFADHYVLRNIRQLLGIDRARWLITGAAPIAPELIEWYWALGAPMFEGYGQTESTGIATANVPGACRFGSIGKPIRDVEIRISDQGEILIRSPGVIQGYWNKPEKTAETVVDGWLHTGDVGRVDADGYVYIMDRLKDIIITAGGKNITPSEIENQLKFSPYISDAVVVGDKRPYLTCLVMIDQENVTKFAQDHDVPFTNYTSLCHAQEVIDLVGGIIEKVNQNFARVETIKKFRLIDQLLDAEDEELTPTMKLKRKVVNEKYIDLIESMYKA